ncbi:glycosyltransferase family 2 protein [Dysgonomonas sp. Marseille-P4677]|uniref:glycosyltransferase family 2 protein n=1 Tax=Dysgonomonas sp. Marseille-P4677 TaxID=2364790 RepID=UPI0019124CDD|nr:glycosyltransferase family 2 protein [Dysgonomonas sp. Marseille-P4677]MBK5721745.1 glycosyltransferase family 2 protein [Dysgonomonas sp. Marseille-P4677]
MISIIVPVYNAECCLSACLDSLLGQTYCNIEVICVNDGSPDKSNSILSDYLKRDQRLKVITQDNRGIASARNRAIKEAQGEWIMFVDSDDWIELTTCERAMNLAKDSKVDVVLWAYTRELGNGRNAPRFLMQRDKLFDEKNIQLLHRQIIGPIGDELRDPTLLHSLGTVWGKLYSRDVILESRFVDTKIIGSGEDVLFNIEVFTRVKRAYYINEIMYHHRKSKKSFTGGHNKNLNECWINLYSMISDIIIAYNLPPDFNKALNSRIVLGLIGQGINECRSPRNIRGKISIIKQIIVQKQYRLAMQDISLKYFPPHWYLFFWAAKNGKANILYVLLSIMSR